MDRWFSRTGSLVWKNTYETLEMESKQSVFRALWFKSVLQTWHSLVVRSFISLVSKLVVPVLPLQRAGRRSSWCWRARPGCMLGLGCPPRAAGWGVHEPSTDLWAQGWLHSSAGPPLGVEGWSCRLTVAAGDKWVIPYPYMPKAKTKELQKVFCQWSDSHPLLIVVTLTCKRKNYRWIWK